MVHLVRRQISKGEERLTLGSNEMPSRSDLANLVVAEETVR
jgi:hypothetical protein